MSGHPFDIPPVPKGRWSDGGTELYAARWAAGLTQSQVAARLKCSQATISRIEDGSTLPSLEQLFEFCAAVELVPADVCESYRREWALRQEGQL